MMHLSERAARALIVFVLALLAGVPVLAQIGGGVGVSSPVGSGANTYSGEQTVDDGSSSTAYGSRTIVATNNTGHVTWDFSPEPADGTSNGLTRFGRTTNTTGIHGVYVLRGDDSTGSIFQIYYDNTANQTTFNVAGVDMLPETGSFEIAWPTACTTTPTQTVNYDRIGKLVHMWTDDEISCTRDVATGWLSSTVFPSSLIPSGATVNGTAPAIMADSGGLDEAACYQIFTNGSMSFRGIDAAADFNCLGSSASSGTGNLGRWSITYSLP